MGQDPFIADAAGFQWPVDHDFDDRTTYYEFAVLNTNPRQPDSELDSMDDGWEHQYGFDSTVNNNTDSTPDNDSTADPDGDGLTNEQESALGTNPNDLDTDGDSVNDKVEDTQGSNPNDPNDSQPLPGGTVAVNVTFGDHSGSHSEKYSVKLEPLEGDTQVRQRSNRKYGALQVDTFHLPKRTRYKVTLVHIGTNPRYRGNPRPDYDYTLSFSSDENDDAVAVVEDDPDGILGEHGESEDFFAEGQEAELFVAELTSECVETAPQDRQRAKVGVGEQVVLTVSPSSVPIPSWAMTGTPGTSSLSATTGVAVTMTAGEQACTPTPEATINGKVLKRAFTVIAPSAIVFEYDSDQNSTNPLKVDMALKIYVAPEDVNFSTVGVAERVCLATATNYFAIQNGQVHNPSPAPLPVTDTLVAGKGWEVNGTDRPIGNTTGPPYGPGTFTWAIPVEYTINGNAYVFTTVNHVKELTIGANSKATLTLTKGAASSSVTEP